MSTEDNKTEVPSKEEVNAGKQVVTASESKNQQENAETIVTKTEASAAVSDLEKQTVTGEIGPSIAPSATATVDDASRKRARDDDAGVNEDLPPVKRVVTEPLQRASVCQIKFVIDNDKAGLIIGKGGAHINMFKMESGCDVQLSQNNHVFPGTTQRVIMLRSGTIEPVKHALQLIHQKLSEAEMATGVMEGELKLLIPTKAAGSIIGKGGDIIKDLKLKSGASLLSVTNEEDMPGNGVDERFVVIRGDASQQYLAAVLILDAMCAEPSCFYYKNSTTSYPGGIMAGGFSSYGSAHTSRGMYGAAPAAYGAPAAATPTSGGSGGYGETQQTVQVPDHMVGLIVGKSGSTIKDFMVQSNCRIKISQKGEYVPGTTNRIITIHGQPNNCQYATQLISDKLATANSRPGAPDNSRYAATAATYAGYGGVAAGQTPAYADYYNRTATTGGAYGAAPAYGAASAYDPSAYGGASAAAPAYGAPATYGTSAYGASTSAYGASTSAYGAAPAAPAANGYSAYGTAPASNGYDTNSAAGGRTY